VSGDTRSSARRGARGLEAGEWSTAKTSFEAALEREETAEALLGLRTSMGRKGPETHKGLRDCENQPAIPLVE
jgi:hypothetical protein